MTIRAAQDDEAADARDDPDALCRRVALAVPDASRALAVAVGEHLTTIVLALGDRPVVLWTVAHGSILAIAARADVDKPLGHELVESLRASAGLALAKARIGVMRLVRCHLVVAASRVGRAVVTLGADGAGAATPRQLAAALETLSSTWEEQSARGASHAWLRTTLVGAAMLEGVVTSLGGGRIVALPEASPLESPATPLPVRVGHSTR